MKAIILKNNFDRCKIFEDTQLVSTINVTENITQKEATKKKPSKKNPINTKNAYNLTLGLS